MESKVQNAIFNEIEVKKEKEVSTNLWIPLSSHIYSHSNRKPWHTSFLVALAGPLYTTTKGADQGIGMKGL